MEGTSSQENASKKHEEGELMAEGRRAFACKDYSKAANAFQEACEIMSVKYGQISKEMGEPSYLYGKSLLELARMENPLFGGGVPVPPEEEGMGEEEESDEEQAEEGEEENKESDDVDRAPKPEEAGPSGSIASSSSAPVNMAEGGEQVPTGNQPSSDEEPTTLQLAWEMFEVTRVIYETSETLEEKLRLAEVNLLLGEVSLESDQFGRAIDDLTSCLKIRELVLKADDRLLAEVHFQLGLAHTFAMNFDDAVAEYEAAKQVLKLRREILQGQLEKTATIDEKEGVKSLQDEMTDIDDLLPDIDSKINDVYEAKKRSIEEAEGQEQPFASKQDSADEDEFKGSTEPQEVHDISHLMRRKTKVNGTHDSLEEDVSTTDEGRKSRKRPADVSEAGSPKRAHHIKEGHVVNQSSAAVAVSSEQ